VLVEDRVLALLVRGRDELVALVLDPLPQTELVLGRSQKLRLLLGVDTALAHSLATYAPRMAGYANTYIVEYKKNLALLFGRCCQRSEGIWLAQERGARRQSGTSACGEERRRGAREAGS
jgi:hypothetical protein